MSTQDIFSYFKEYPPAHIEWLDDTSCKYTTFLFSMLLFMIFKAFLLSLIVNNYGLNYLFLTSVLSLGEKQLTC